MKKQKKIKKEKGKVAQPKKGFIAAYALIAASIIVVLLTGLFVFIADSHQRGLEGIYRQQALQFAESGIYFYKWYLAHNLDGKNAQQIKDFWESGIAYGLSEPYQKEVYNEIGELVGMYELNVSISNPNSTIVMVESEGWTAQHPETTRSVGVRFRRPSWSEFSVLANDVMRFGSGTNVFGPIHSNNGIRFDGVANNLISSSVETYWDPDTYSIRPGVWTSQSNESEVFLAGNDFPVAAVDFNGVTTDLILIRDEASAEGIYLANETYEAEQCGWIWSGWPPPLWDYQCSTENVPVEGYHITLRTDDQVEIRRVLDYSTYSYQIEDETEAEVFDIPENGLMFFGDHVWVDGQVDTAQVTIASADIESAGNETNIYINNDVLYTNKDGQDVIGLIAENDITVGLYSEDNLEIDAALLAQKGRVGRDHYGSGSYRIRDEITVFGSLATSQRYGFAWTDGTGYQIRNLYFDNNLLYTPPPFFPTGTVYELDLWEDL